MNQRQIGLLLRAFGPIVQIVGIILFVDSRRGGGSIFGMPQGLLGLILVAIGLVVVVTGLWMSYTGRRKKGEAEESDYQMRL